MDETRPLGALRLHPRVDVVPFMPPEEQDQLLADIERRGVVVPLDILPDGTILDGRTRYSVAQAIGLAEVPVRIVEPEDPFDYMVRAALLRRHLTPHQKKQLNDVLRAMTVEVVVQPASGQEVRVGMGQTQRARALGVDRMTVRDWDGQAERVGNPTDRPDAPTHYRSADGRVKTLHPDRATPRAKAPERVASPRERARAAARREFGATPVWMARLTRWARRALPEQRVHLLRIKAEVEHALDLIEQGGKS